MIYIGSKEACENYAKKNNINFFNDLVHPSEAEEKAHDLEQSEKDFICYNTVILDFINPRNIIFINDDLSIENFFEKFNKEINYMYPGEIILNKY